MKAILSKLILGMMVVGFLAGCAGLGASQVSQISDEELFGKTSDIPI